MFKNMVANQNIKVFIRKFNLRYVNISVGISALQNIAPDIAGFMPEFPEQGPFWREV